METICGNMVSGNLNVQAEKAIQNNSKLICFITYYQQILLVIMICQPCNLLISLYVKIFPILWAF